MTSPIRQVVEPPKQPDPVEASATAIVMAGWDHAPHLDEKAKAEILAECEPHLRESRMRGIPHLGSGAIYPIALEEFTIEPFEIKPWYVRGYGMDVGWNNTAMVWGALDKDTDTMYLYDCYKRGNAEPEIHAAAAKRRYVRNTQWVGLIDPAAHNRQGADGKRLIQMYRKEGLKLIEADNTIESGIYSVWSRLSTGRLKIFKGVMSMWAEEYRMYARDIHGKIVKHNDHLMDATRYLIHSGMPFLKPVIPQRTMGVSSRDYGY